MIATLAFIGFAIVFYMRSRYVIEIDTWHLVLPTLLQGIPMALFFVPLTAIILSGQPPQKIPAAAGLSNFARVFCGAVGTSLAGNAWNNRTVLHHERLTRAGQCQQSAVQSADAIRLSRCCSLRYAVGACAVRFHGEHASRDDGAERYLLCLGDHLHSDHSADLDHTARKRRWRPGCGWRALTRRVDPAH